ncbi:uncharacterized protein BX664DRAFT_373184 [Halteromyces radiatus]|uniref:uncharacterized protein n=1 Tax=Halteromyces radiatus TaxID=101107 RepID=UPI0022212015|nr:uncharacterized protein BX664DRAFT_373184 [Halteromyces radiatus]KAI8089138.1 hypothetical protein BX664DRAFT_373184 [Halteromyces radiatus]
MDSDSQWSDFYDLLLQEDDQVKETDDEWTSIKKTSKGQIEFQQCSTMDDPPKDVEFDSFVSQLLTQVNQCEKESNQSTWQHMDHKKTCCDATNSTQRITVTTKTLSNVPTTSITTTTMTTNREQSMDRMPGTFDTSIGHHHCHPCTNQCTIDKKKVSSSRLFDIHTWVMILVLIAHLFVLFWRPS